MLVAVNKTTTAKEDGDYTKLKIPIDNNRFGRESLKNRSKSVSHVNSRHFKVSVFK